jgi:hypothetical protein
MADPIEGGCYCGAVRYRAGVDPLYRINCHCANCRRAAGAQAVAWVTFPLAAFEFVAGAPVQYRTDTGARRTFCGACGTSLTYENERRTGEVDVTVGSLDHPESFGPTMHAYTEERLPWLPLLPDTTSAT